MKRVALLVGVNHYEDEDVTPLKVAQQDAMDLGAFLKHRAGFDPVRTFIAGDADTDGILNSARELVGGLSSGDLFLFYFAGHGYEYQGKHLLLCPKARVSRLEFHYHTVPVDLLKKETAKNGVSRLFVLDACRSEPLRSRGGSGDGFRGGQVLRDLVGTTARPRSPLTVLSSCGDGQVARELCEVGHGLFTQALLKELEEAAEAGRGVVVGTGLTTALSSRMKALLAQHGMEAEQEPWIAQSGGREVELLPASIAKAETNGADRSREVSPVGAEGVASTSIPAEPKKPSGSRRRTRPCPICGCRNAIDDTFKCVRCERDYLCRAHYRDASKCCEECEEAQREAERKARLEHARMLMGRALAPGRWLGQKAVSADWSWAAKHNMMRVANLGTVVAAIATLYLYYSRYPHDSQRALGLTGLTPPDFLGPGFVLGTSLALSLASALIAALLVVAGGIVLVVGRVVSPSTSLHDLVWYHLSWFNSLGGAMMRLVLVPTALTCSFVANSWVYRHVMLDNPNVALPYLPWYLGPFLFLIPASLFFQWYRLHH